MKAVPGELLSKLQKRANFIRNICILAHVDHGKTTLADTLVASNGIISAKMAGKLRYMDSLEEEQLRGITMKSSAISLYYTNEGEHYLVNLIDSPGHIDFSSEVSTAVRLCDGAIVVIDAVEGVSPQTHAVLRQAGLENIRPVLLINKIDRLITELKLTPSESHTHLQQLLEQVNAVMAQLISGDILRKSAEKDEKTKQTNSDENRSCNKEPQTASADQDDIYNWDSGLHADENDDSHLYFSPDLGNVVFGSAIDSWAFSIDDFASLYSAKLGLNKKVLSKTLWGDFYFNTKTKKVMKGASHAGKKPLFVQMIMDNIWKVYNTVLDEYRDNTAIEKLISALNIKIAARDLKSADSRVVLKSVMSQWLPISKATLSMVVAHTPSPLSIGEERVEALMCDHSVKFDSLHDRTRALKSHFLKCSSADEEPVIVYVSKMFPVEKEMFPENQHGVLTKADLEQRKEIARQRHHQRMLDKGRQPDGDVSDKGRQPDGDVTEESSQIITSHTQQDATGVDMATSHPDPAEDRTATESRKSESDDGNNYRFLAFARIFSGKIKRGQKLYVLGPKHNPAEAIEQGYEERLADSEGLTVDKLTSDLHMTQIEVSDLFTFMGRELEPMEEIPAGNILGIGGLEDHILKSATLSSDIACTPFSNMMFEAQPIVRVAIEPRHPSDMDKLVRGMRLLNQADSCVQVMVQETGEHVLIAAGEVHLQRCCEDLRKRYCGISIEVSEPIVPFRETIVEPPKTDMVNEAIEGENVIIRNKDSEPEEKLISITRGNVTLAIEAVPLPTAVTDLIDNNDKLLQSLDHHLSQNIGGRVSRYDRQTSLTEQSLVKLQTLHTDMAKAFKDSDYQWGDACDRIWCFGPRKYGPNMLINGVEGYDRPSIWQMLSSEYNTQQGMREFDSSIVNGFQLATLTGPMCAEPLRGVAFIVKQWEIVNIPAPNPTVIDLKDEDANSDAESDSASAISGSKKSALTGGTYSGQIISLVKEVCRRAFQAQPQRLMCAMYSCDIQATANVLGKVYGVIGKRNGRVIQEEMQEGTQIFSIAAVLPIAESFGFSDEIRKRTSGLASPQLAFSHWEAIDVDPFWEPCTEEEMAHYGEKYDSENRAKNYMNQVRKRKGLKTEDKIVMHAEKQRTLGKNK